MKPLILLSLLALGGSVARAETAMDQLQDCADRRCGWNRTPLNLAVDTTGTPNPAEMRLASYSPATARTSGTPALAVRSEPARRGGGIGRFIMPALLAGGGGYLGYAGILPFSIGGPWVMAAVGAAIGLAVALFILPKIFSLFRRRR